MKTAELGMNTPTMRDYQETRASLRIAHACVPTTGREERDADAGVGW